MLSRKPGAQGIYLPWERRAGISRGLGLGRARPPVLLAAGGRAARGVRRGWERRAGISRRLGLGRLRPVFLVAAVLAAVVMLGMRERQRTGERSTRAALLVVRRALDNYRADHEGKCPKQLEELEQGRYLKDL